MCPDCHQVASLRRKQYFLHPPETLVINLKRYTVTGNRCTKNADVINISPTLNLDGYVMKEDKFAATSEPGKGESAQYSLYGIVEHHGETANSGHYTAYIKNNDSYANSVCSIR